MDREELAGWLRLALPGVGNQSARRLLAAFGLPATVIAQPLAALKQVVGPQEAEALATPHEDFAQQVERTLQWLEAGDADAPRHVLTLADARYPPGLLQIADPPLVLYVTGEPPTPWPDGIAIVGSRNATAQGVANARAFAESFARSGLTVVSGLALGIDGAAHEGALAGAAPGTVATVAVVGTGLDRVYPKQHRDLAHRIAARGLIVSEYPVGTPPLAPNFPKRNRIIAALTHGTVVVEAALQSGSLITAKQAAEQGKEVFAIPGSIHSPQSRGCHALIKQGAKLVETAQDVLEELPQLAGRAAAATAPLRAPAAGGDAVLDALGFDPSTLDALVARTGIAAPQLQARLLELELAGQVARLAGGLYQRIASA
ncbi:DNA-processing protein DprA [Ramlibacter sp. PS4R-6]|uniref:DNA-processing protein DprA n=1 Tax=Ramlibacter sp. PS4R-6 TaxID=3133438 RepID=UPI00309BEEDA